MVPICWLCVILCKYESTSFASVTEVCGDVECNAWNNEVMLDTDEDDAYGKTHSTNNSIVNENIDSNLKFSRMLIARST
jgi:hypothetical protein